MDKNIKEKLYKYIKIFLIIVSIIVLLILALKVINEKLIDFLYKKEYSEYVSKYSQEYNVDENLIYAIIKSESNFKTEAISHKGAKGLMQLIDTTAKEIAERNDINILNDDFSEPNTNIKLGTIYISELLEKYSSVEVALAAYNAGGGNVDKWLKNGIIKEDGSDIENIPFKETNMYVRKILRDYKIYSNRDSH